MNKIWMVKIPEVVYNGIMKQKEASKDIGNFNVYEVETKDKKKLEIEINLNNELKFDLNFSKTDNYFYFRDKKPRMRKIQYFGKLIANDENVSDRITMKVQEDEIKNKPCISIETGKGRPATTGIIKILETHPTKQRRDKNLKKTRMDREELKSEIFSLFSEKDFWSIKELVEELDQPENYLKEILGEICNYIKSGPSKGCYELKQQYVKSNNM